MKEKIEKLVALKRKTRNLTIAAVVLIFISLSERIYWITENPENSKHMFIGLCLANIITFLTIGVVLIVYELYKQYIDVSIKNEKIRPEVIKKFRLSKDEYMNIECIDNNILNDERLKHFNKYNLEFLARIVSDSEVEVIIRQRNREDKNKMKNKHNFIYLDKHYVPTKYSGKI